MKTTPILLAAALALGAAGAQAQNEAATGGSSGARQPSGGPSLVDKAKNAGKRIAEKTRGAFNKGEQKVDQARDNNRDRDTAAMGAGRTSRNSAGSSDTGSTASSGDRRSRMDDAYSNWQRQGGTTTRQ